MSTKEKILLGFCLKKRDNFVHRFKMIQEAYSVLKSPEKRRDYDSTLLHRPGDGVTEEEK
jgi:DnaJ-class molecular chaperone